MFLSIVRSILLRSSAHLVSEMMPSYGPAPGGQRMYSRFKKSLYSSCARIFAPIRCPIGWFFIPSKVDICLSLADDDCIYAALLMSRLLNSLKTSSLREVLEKIGQILKTFFMVLVRFWKHPNDQVSFHAIKNESWILLKGREQLRRSPESTNRLLLSPWKSRKRTLIQLSLSLTFLYLPRPASEHTFALPSQFSKSLITLI